MSQPVDSDQTPAVIRLEGELNSLTSARLREQLQAHQAAGRIRILIDLAAVTFIDSSGLSALVAGLKSLKLSGGRLALLGLQPQARTIFAITQADTLFAIFDDEQAARAFLADTGA
jgi:anti-sigma B factor antagonist